MRIRRRSHRPAGSATPSSTSKELPRCSPRLSRHLNPHSADPGALGADRLEELPVPTRALPEGAEPVESAELVDDELDELLEEY